MSRFMRGVRDNGGHRGVPYEETCTPEWDNYVLAIAGIGANGSTSFPDLSPRANDYTGSAGAVEISNADSIFYGTSVKFTASAMERYDADFNVPSPVPFSMRCKYKPSTGAGSFFNWTDGSTTIAFALSSGSVVLRTNGTNLTGPALTTGVAYDLEAAWDGTTRFIFVNGALVAADTAACPQPSSGAVVQLGGWGPNGFGYLTGYANDLEFVMGLNLHTSSFTPPTRDLLTRARRYPSVIAQR